MTKVTKVIYFMKDAFQIDALPLSPKGVYKTFIRRNSPFGDRG